MKNILVLLIFAFFHPHLQSQDLFEYVKNGDYKAVKKCKCNVNIQDNFKATPLMWGVYHDDLKMVKLLLKKGADIHLKGWIRFVDSVKMSEFMYGSCLVIAAGENYMDMLHYLFKKTDVGVNDREINLYDNIENGWTALHWAVVKSNHKVIDYLVSEGADINAEAETDARQTPVHFAIRFGNNRTAKQLIGFGCDINKKDAFENSPLMYAFHYKNREMVKYLIEHNARPGIQGMNINDLIKEYFGVEGYSEL